MNILLIYPKYPDTFWSFKHALRFISKKAAVPPLGLITVSAMLPLSWNKKLVDLNIEDLIDTDLSWADYVFISGMYVQKSSVNWVIEQCKRMQVKIVAGGPLFTQDFEEYPQVDHFVLNEAEITLPLFLSDINKGVATRVYQTKLFAEMLESPVPDYHLLNRNAYAAMNLQFSRGCPFNCDFCEITTLLGHKVRMKSPQQIIKELDALYKLKWKGAVSVVDDNFIGNKKELKTALLPEMLAWGKQHKYPFNYNAQTSINLADDEELMQMMRDVGFVSTFIGIETPVEESLQLCHKHQNKNRDLLQNIFLIQKWGIQVSGGFIVGFDSDLESVFQKQIDFIQSSGIVSAMVGLLNAPKHTTLYKQMDHENRLREDSTGCNTDFTMNFKPKMNADVLLNGYKSIIKNIYSAKPFYKRARKFLLNYKPKRIGKSETTFTSLIALVKSILIIGIVNKGQHEYWKFLFWTLCRKPRMLVEAIRFAVYGYHYRTVYGLRDGA